MWSAQCGVHSLLPNPAASSSDLTGAISAHRRALPSTVYSVQCTVYSVQRRVVASSCGRTSVACTAPNRVERTVWSAQSLKLRYVEQRFPLMCHVPLPCAIGHIPWTIRHVAHAMCQYAKCHMPCAMSLRAALMAAGPSGFRQCINTMVGGPVWEM